NFCREACGDASPGGRRGQRPCGRTPAQLQPWRWHVSDWLLGMSIAPPSDRDVDDAPAVAAARGGASRGASGARLSPRATLRGRRSIAYGACREGGDPIILVSGAVADEVVWGPQLRHLRDHRFLAWTPRLPGPGVTLAESLGDLF